VLILPFAALSDRVGRRPMLIAGSALFVVAAYPLFLLLNSGSLTAGVELFATRVRYSGFSVGYNIAVAGFGGTTPYVVTWLTGATGALAPAFYLMGAALLSLLTVLGLRETAGTRLRT